MFSRTISNFRSSSSPSRRTHVHRRYPVCPKALHHLLGIPAEDNLVLDLHDLVLGLEANPVCGGILDRADDQGFSVPLADVYPEPPVLPFHLDFLFLELAGVNETGVGIPPGLHHPLDGAVEELVFIGGLLCGIHLVGLYDGPGLFHEPHGLGVEGGDPLEVAEVGRTRQPR